MPVPAARVFLQTVENNHGVAFNKELFKTKQDSKLNAQKSSLAFGFQSRATHQRRSNCNNKKANFITKNNT